MKKARLKTENNFAIYETVLHNKCIVCSKLIMSQFLSTLEGWLDVPSYLETQFRMSVNKN